MSNPCYIFMEKTYGHFAYDRDLCLLQPEESDAYIIFPNDPCFLCNKTFLFLIKITCQVPSEAITLQKEVAVETMPIMAR